MKPAPFDYHRPSTVEEAVGLLAELDGAKVLAGGQSLLPLLNLRLAYLDHLVDLAAIDELRGIERRNGMLRVGASTTQATAEHSAVVAETIPLLQRAIPLIGHFQIRNRGTIGGSVAHADPASEIPAVALALDATIEAASAAGRRSIPAREFFLGTWTTALMDDEILTAVEFPIWSGRCGFAVEEFSRRHGDFAIAGAAVGIEIDAHDTVVRATIGVLGLGSTPERATAAEQSMLGLSTSDIDVDALGAAAMADLGSVPSDLNGSADYRIRVGAAVTSRALTGAIEEARNG